MIDEFCDLVLEWNCCKDCYLNLKFKFLFVFCYIGLYYDWVGFIEMFFWKFCNRVD